MLLINEAKTGANKKPYEREQLDSLINEASDYYKISPDVVHGLIQQESRYDPYADSYGSKTYRGARGIGQHIASTAKEIGMTNRYDPVQGVYGAALYLKKQLAANGNDLDKALVAYNAGSGVVQKAVAKYGKDWKKGLSGAIQETYGDKADLKLKEVEDYVASINRNIKDRRKQKFPMDLVAEIKRFKGGEGFYEDKIPESILRGERMLGGGGEQKPIQPVTPQFTLPSEPQVSGPLAKEDAGFNPLKQGPLATPEMKSDPPTGMPATEGYQKYLQGGVASFPGPMVRTIKTPEELIQTISKNKKGLLKR